VDSASHRAVPLLRWNDLRVNEKMALAMYRWLQMPSGAWFHFWRCT
jgi:hypothetical protein